MSRISKPPSAHAPEDLLEAGRRQPVLRYDVEVGLAHLHARLEAHAPMPDWARPSATLAERTLASTLIKAAIASVLATAIAFVLFSMRESSRSAPTRVERSRTLASDATPSALEPSEPARMDPNPDGLGNRPPKLSASARPTERAAEARAQSGRVMVRPGKPPVPQSPPARAASPIRDRRVDAPMPAQPPDTRAGRAPARGVVEASTAPVPPARAASASAQIAPPASPLEPKAPRREAPTDLLEMHEIAEAEQLLLSAPARALSLVRSGDQRFAHGYFQQERAYVAIMALIKLSRRPEAEAAAARFYARYPPMPYGARVRRALDAARSAADTNGE